MLHQDFMPIFMVRNLEHSLRFYREVLGFAIQRGNQEETVFVYCQGKHTDIAFMLEQGTAEELERLRLPYGEGLRFSFWVRDLQALYERVQSTGYPVFRSLNRRSIRVDNQIKWAGMFSLQDPDGYLLSFQE